MIPREMQPLLSQVALLRWHCAIFTRRQSDEMALGDSKWWRCCCFLLRRSQALPASWEPSSSATMKEVIQRFCFLTRRSHKSSAVIGLGGRGRNLYTTHEACFVSADGEEVQDAAGPDGLRGSRGLGSITGFPAPAAVTSTQCGSTRKQTGSVGGWEGLLGVGGVAKAWHACMCTAVCVCVHVRAAPFVSDATACWVLGVCERSDSPLPPSGRGSPAR